MIHDSILDTVGRTPVVRINRLAPKGVEMFVKVEAFNPMSSVKDRLALGIVLDAESRGELKPGQMVVEATSGNTGIALAMAAAIKGYRMVLIMPEDLSVERAQTMKAFGAELILVSKEEGMEGARDLAEQAAPAGQLVRRSRGDPRGCDHPG